MVDFKSTTEDLAAGLAATVGDYPAPTAYMGLNEDGVLCQKWVGVGGETWVPVPSLQAAPPAASGAAGATGASGSSKAAPAPSGAGASGSAG